MTDLELRVDEELVAAIEGWTLTWIDRAAGVVRITPGDGRPSRLALVEGRGSAWLVTLGGRRIPVTVATWRERVLAEAEGAARGHAGPIEVKATLPGLVVAVATTDGAEVAEGDALVTIEAMKMQNEVRAPRAGRVAGLAVSPGRRVATGELLLRLE